MNGFLGFFETGDRKARKRKDQTRMGWRTGKDKKWELVPFFTCLLYMCLTYFCPVGVSRTSLILKELYHITFAVF